MNDNSNLAAYYFHQGTNFRSYEYFGCHLIKHDVSYVYAFRTWAPNAYEIYLVSDFTGWDCGIPLTRLTENGIWELIYESKAPLA